MKKYEQYDTEDFLKDELFVKWVKTNSKEVEHFWQSWISQHPEKLPTIQKASEILLSAQKKQQPSHTNKDYDDVLEGILKRQGRKSTGSQEFIPVNKTVAKYAASVLLLISLSFWLIKANLDAPADPLDSPNMITKNTPMGSKLNIRLADGTLVKLNAGAELTFPEHFAPEGVRTVVLKGEAFFEVRRDVKRPFIIKSDHIQTTVLGTSFNMNTAEGHSGVTVVSGKVKVDRANADLGSENTTSVYLQKGEKATFEKETGLLVKGKANLAAATAWKDGIIYFNASSFEQVEEKLSAWYGVNFENETKIEGVFSGRFKDKTLSEVLEGLSYTGHFSYKIQKDKVYIF